MCFQKVVYNCSHMVLIDLMLQNSLLGGTVVVKVYFTPLFDTWLFVVKIREICCLRHV